MAEDSNHDPAANLRLLTQKQYADRKGWSKQYVNQLVKRGRIPLQDGRIDPMAADAAMATTRDPAQDTTFKTPPMSGETLKDEAGRAMAPNAQSSYAKVRTVREYYRALREQLEYEQLSGKLVPASEVEEAGAFAALEFKRGFEAAAMRAGQAVAARFHLDEQEVLAVFQEETIAALAELGQRFREKVAEFQDENVRGLDEDEQL